MNRLNPIHPDRTWDNWRVIIDGPKEVQYKETVIMIDNHEFVFQIDFHSRYR